MKALCYERLPCYVELLSGRQTEPRWNEPWISVRLPAHAAAWDRFVQWSRQVGKTAAMARLNIGDIHLWPGSAHHGAPGTRT